MTGNKYLSELVDCSALQKGKLNINSFICKKEINKQAESNGIKITVLSQEVYKDNETMKKLVTNAMNADFSWKESAKKYIEVYERK